MLQVLDSTLKLTGQANIMEAGLAQFKDFWIIFGLGRITKKLFSGVSMHWIHQEDYSRASEIPNRELLLEKEALFEALNMVQVCKPDVSNLSLHAQRLHILASLRVGKDIQ
ncbi:hypothetical protein MHU86_25468 [Fragilaria crotonensis]|nr:hypothetical protein MHU86_25468 [Fragilaria crotonensis]